MSFTNLKAEACHKNRKLDLCPRTFQKHLGHINKEFIKNNAKPNLKRIHERRIDDELCNISAENIAVEKWFQAMNTQKECCITGKELQNAFSIFQNRHFSDLTCEFIVRVFNLDRCGGVNLKEFNFLYNNMKAWLDAFHAYDRSESGYLDEIELEYAFKQLDINFTPRFINFLITRNNPKAKKLSLDQFLITCIQIQKFTNDYKERGKNFMGNINVKYEDFLEMLMKS